MEKRKEKILLAKILAGLGVLMFLGIMCWAPDESYTYDIITASSVLIASGAIVYHKSRIEVGF